MRRSRLLMIVAALVVGGILLRAPAFAAETIRVASQKTGTFAWELDVMRAHGFDTEAGLSIEIRALASPEAGQIALNGGSADLIVADWLWVSRERRLGEAFVFYPYSSALGAIMVPRESTIGALADLKGHALAVAGGPIDKSWLLVQAAAKLDGVDLKSAASIVYGAPALLFAKALQGELDASLNFWNFCAALEAKGWRRLVGVEDLLPKLGLKGRPALLGYVFREGWARQHREAIAHFLDATRKAKDLLATSDAEWERIAPLVGTTDAAALAAYRTRYREGIPRRPIGEEEADARTLFGLLAKLGGSALVGDAGELAPGTFYEDAAGP